MKLLLIAFFIITNIFASESYFQKADQESLNLMCESVKQEFSSEQALKKCLNENYAWDQFSSQGELRATFIITKSVDLTKSKIHPKNISHCVEQSLDGDFSCAGVYNDFSFWTK